MSRVCPAHFVILAVVALGNTTAGAQPTFRTSVDLVRVTATVTAGNGRDHVGGLTSDDFVITDGGREQPITSFSAERQAVSVLFLLDISLSMKGAASEHARRAVLTFVRDYFGHSDEALVCVFNSAVTCANRWTRNADALAAALQPIVPRGATRLLDAVAFVLPLFNEARHRKQVLVVMSDGKDLNSAHSPRAVAEQMRQFDVLTYAIAFPSSDANQLLLSPGSLPGESLLDLPTLRGLTTPTGGRTFPVSSSSRIAEAVRSIVNELGSQYLLGYNMPAGKPGYREITVRLKDKPFDVRARRGYVAAARER
jgi:VWFA-related protein